MTPREGESSPWTGAESPDPMDDDRRCRATARSGNRCKRYAIPGGRVCVMHGGASPRVRAAAERRKAEAEATALLELIWDPNAEPVTDPVAALQALAGKLQHAADVLGARMAAAELDGPTGLAWARVLRELRQALEGMERLDLAGRHIELEQGRATMVSSAVLAAMNALGLSPVDRSSFVRVFLAGLRVENAAASTQALLGPWEETEPALAQSAGAQLAEVVQAILQRLSLTPDQWEAVSVVVPEEFRRLARRETVRGELE